MRLCLVDHVRKVLGLHFDQLSFLAQQAQHCFWKELLGILASFELARPAELPQQHMCDQSVVCLLLRFWYDRRGRAAGRGNQRMLKRGGGRERQESRKSSTPSSDGWGASRYNQKQPDAMHTPEMSEVKRGGGAGVSHLAQGKWSVAYHGLTN